MATGGALVILLDEIATMVKVAAEKTDSVADKSPAKIGDDDYVQKRDMSILIDVAKGSLKNKAILVPAALAVHVLMPWAVMPLLAAGGAYFAYEGIGKMKALWKGEEHHHAPADIPGEDAAAARARKVKSAIKTDMILSGEITAVTMAATLALPFVTQAMIMTGVALGATIGVYGVITGIIKMEDLGTWLASRKSDSLPSKAARPVGRALLAGKPHVLNGISIAGALAIFMVGGGLLFHGIPAAGEFVNNAISSVVSGTYMHSIVKLGASFAAGVTTGLVAKPVVHVVKKPVKESYKFLRQWVPEVLTIRAKTPAQPAPAEAPKPVIVPEVIADAAPLTVQDIKPAFDAAAQPAAPKAVPQWPVHEQNVWNIKPAAKRDNPQP
ncbi:MAG: DUF808 family protein [Alphaproteobacteria bacterium]|nr:DUF808 family protein [Alphaproteobacteria bacterium]